MKIVHKINSNNNNNKYNLQKNILIVFINNRKVCKAKNKVYKNQLSPIIKIFAK